MFPYLFSASFDRGDNMGWNSESDTGGLLDFPHYTELAQIPGAPAPYRGAYCMRIQPGDTNDHTLIEGDIDIADTATRYIRFALFISQSFGATANDIFNIFEWHSAGPVVEACISLNVTAATDEVTIAIADGTEASSGFTALSKGVWHVIEALFTVDVTPGTDGVLTLWVDGQQVQTVTGHNQAAAISQAALGTQNTLSTTNTGFLLFDEFAFDDTRLAISHRFAPHRLISDSSFLFMGPGRVDNIKILDGGSGDVILQLYDTDVFNSSMTPVFFDRTATATVNVDAADVPMSFSRGCMALLSGTLGGAVISIGHAAGWGSDGAVRSYAARRT